MVEEMVQQYLSQMTPEQVMKSDAYFEGGYWLLLWNLIVGLLMAYVLLFKGWSVKFRNLAQKATGISFFQDCLYYVIYTVATTLVLLPWSYYVGFYREHQYDLSNLSFLQWLGELGKGTLVAVLFGALLVSVIYSLVRKLKNNWWIFGSIVTISFLAFFMLVFPVFVAPIFNTYKPLEDGPIKESILTMARANGIDASEVYQFDASKQSKRISANVSGLAGTMRISLNDNLLNRTSPAEIRAVMGHEIGHYVLNHVYEMLIYFGLVFLAGFAFVHFSMISLVQRWGSRMGIESVSDIAGFPLVIALLSLYFFVCTPILNSIVRSNESEADIFGLNAAREPDGFATTALKLSEYRKMSPTPLEEVIFYDHPSGESRIRMAMKWKVENQSSK